MTFRDFVTVSAGNLWRMKLRTFLTVSGVVIAIAAFVSMISFGAGNQRNVTREFEELGLLFTMQVYPKTDKPIVDSVKAAVLDQATVQKLAQIPGVTLAFPMNAFTVTVAVSDTIIKAGAQALPKTATQTKLFSQLQAGTFFSADSAREAVVTEEFLRMAGNIAADSIIGRSLILSARTVSIDSGIARVIPHQWADVRKEFDDVVLDSLRRRDYVNRVAREKLGTAMARFFDGFVNSKAIICDTLTVCGVIKGERHGWLRTEPIIIPMATAMRFTSGGIADNPVDLFSSLSNGTLFAGNGAGGASYPQVTLQLDPKAPYQPVRDSVEAMGFRCFSFAEQFSKLRKVFVYFNMALGVIGLIALITASLGIVNTMVMSILERTREIGVLKSLGADDRDIRLLFLVESGVIGTIGALVGIIFGWLITRAASAVAKALMAKDGFGEIELFALPLWLVLTAMGIGIVVSLAAGYYPAARAARVDPVKALRAE
jgi:putative ABC transport system permease protein